MGGGLSRTVDIEIQNKTKDITLKNPRTFLWSGHNTKAPTSEVRPGCFETCHFSSSTIFWGCNGVLAYEGKNFVLTLYFSNPVDYNRFQQEVGLDLSKDEVSETNLRDTYTRLVGGKCTSPACASHRVTLERPPEPLKVSAGPVEVTATMSRRRHATITVVVEDREVPGKGNKEEEVVEDWDVPGKGGKKEKVVEDWDVPGKGGKKEKMVEEDREGPGKGGKKEKMVEDREGPGKRGKKEKMVEEDREGPGKRGKKETPWAVKEAHLV